MQRSTPELDAPVLALDTCGARATLALLRNSGEAPVVLRESALAPKTAGAQLTAALATLLGGVPPSALGAVIVVRGPGSFTGMRIGLSAAKALAEAAGVPLIAVSRLAVLAAAGRDEAAALHAGRGNLYLRFETGAGDEAGSRIEERLISAEEAQNLCIGCKIVVCESRAAALLPGAQLIAEPEAADAARYAWPRLLRADWDDPATLDALYLWGSEQMLGVGAPP